MRTLVMVIAIAAFAAAGCGKSEEQKQAEQAAEELKKAAESVAKAAEQAGTALATQSANDVSKALATAAAAMGGKTADGKPIEPMTFQALQTALPEMSGWTMAKPSAADQAASTLRRSSMGTSSSRRSLNDRPRIRMSARRTR